MKILILKPSSLGDVIQALPVLRLLKLHIPESRLYWWIDSSFSSLLEGDPDLAGVIPFERRRWGSPRNWDELCAAILNLRSMQFDRVIDLQCLARTGAIAWLANGAFSVGLDEPREGARGFYDRIAVRPTYHTHAVDWYLSVLPMLGVPVLKDFTWIPERPIIAAAARHRWPTMESKRWTLLIPGARWENKRWPVEHYAELVRLLAETDPIRHFCILGGAGDRPLGEQISSACPDRCLNLAGSTSLLEMVEWIRQGEFMVSNDTGPMHVAAALGKPVIALFGPTDPRRTGPYGQVEYALQPPISCGPCMKSRCINSAPGQCLKSITPGMALQQIQARLGIAR